MSSVEPIKITTTQSTLNQNNVVESDKNKNIELFPVNQKLEPPSTGNLVGFINPDGTSYVIDYSKSTITKYSKSKDVIETRELTDQERALSSDELRGKIQDASTATNQENKPQKTPPNPDVHQILGDDLKGSYKITDKEDGSYTLEQNFVVSTFKNKAALAFSKDLHQFGLSIEPDGDGYYNYRGIKTKNYNALSMMVEQESKLIAGKTAIYNDLRKRQTAGETLSDGEQKFMQVFKESLTGYGLQINDNGELEDIPQTKNKKAKKR